ncbi:hypothetical protein A1O1_00652 [Capronia coronata CBS 617.96]|uniref:Ig-like domain-containing protein n=1 Tax=Capronia coronata CBS 617.96 TaxID=1182541 RepID=W9Z0R4_9EURO|nr:uncharacterized protein A1O1_00652 [Capronia coronata CBS 617.96]EXJ95530.1 hypothetical protein A1O1_00652 [Capronia coronata CBS 617.96]
MKLSALVAFKAALTLVASTAVSGEILTTIEPCPSATALSYAPITVSAQYQPVSTCNPMTACVKGQCSTIYPFTTYPYVSTVVPCAWNGTITQTTTVTDIKQPFRASEYLETLTQVTAVPSAPKQRGKIWVDWFHKEKQTKTQTSLYETVTRRAGAPFNEIGPLAVPGYDGSGLCHKCIQPDGRRSQLLAVVECRFGIGLSGKEYQKCVEWYEMWIEQPPMSTAVEAVCSSAGEIPSAGVYTWTFPQIAPPVITTTTKTVTVTTQGRPSITFQPEVHTFPGQPWNAYVTKSFSGPTTFHFEVHITKTIILNLPCFTQPAETTRTVSVPYPSGVGHGKPGWWPIPGGDASWLQTKTAGQAWQDWNPTASNEQLNRCSHCVFLYPLHHRCFLL